MKEPRRADGAQNQRTGEAPTHDPIMREQEPGGHANSRNKPKKGSCGGAGENREEPHRAETSIAPYRHIPSASEDGESSLVEDWNETQQLPAGAGAETPVGRGTTGKRRRRRWTRRPTWMDRAPFLTAARRYLRDVRAFYRESTLERYGRDLRTVYRDLQALGVETTPAKLREGHIKGLLLRWQTRTTTHGGPMEAASQEKLLTVLDGFLTWMGNPVVSRMRQQRHVRFPHAVPKPIQVLNPEDLARLREAAEGTSGWPGRVARFLVAFLPYSGLRPKEIRLARLADLDLGRGRILVSHPKGENAWAAPDYAPIPPPAREALEDFLAEREAYLAGESCEWLIPLRRYRGTEPTGPWSAAMLRKLKAELQSRSGVSFRGLKTFRATFAQSAKDGGATIEAVSRAMRHRSTKTTEAFYARIRADDAFREIERAFEKPVVRIERT